MRSRCMSTPACLYASSQHTKQHVGGSPVPEGSVLVRFESISVNSFIVGSFEGLNDVKSTCQGCVVSLLVPMCSCMWRSKGKGGAGHMVARLFGAVRSGNGG